MIATGGGGGGGPDSVLRYHCGLGTVYRRSMFCPCNVVIIICKFLCFCFCFCFVLVVLEKILNKKNPKCSDQVSSLCH